MYHYFIHFYCWIIFSCINIPYFAYAFVSWWTFVVFSVCGGYEYAAVNICVHVFPVWTYAFSWVYSWEWNYWESPCFYSPGGKHHLHLEMKKPSPPSVEVTCRWPRSSWVIGTGTLPGPLTQNPHSLVLLFREIDLRRERARGEAELGSAPSRCPNSHLPFLTTLPNTSTLVCGHHLSTSPRPSCSSVDQLPPLGKEIGPIKSFTAKC